MILVELNTPDQLPSIRAISAPDFIRLAVRLAYGAGESIPVSMDEAAALLRQGRAGVWAFYTLESADIWAAEYDGPKSAEVRFLVRDYVLTRYATPADEMDPDLYAGAA